MIAVDWTNLPKTTHLGLSFRDCSFKAAETNRFFTHDPQNGVCVTGAPGSSFVRIRDTVAVTKVFGPWIYWGPGRFIYGYACPALSPPKMEEAMPA